MATTRIIAMHVNRGRNIAQCLTDRIAYAENPEKTEQRSLISSFACDPHTADEEFMLAKRQYERNTGRSDATITSGVIAYQVRQSFKPGEITPEEANSIGYELADRFLKGHHAFIVATHVDKAHIHNHIIWNSTDRNCQRKFYNFLGSGKAIARLSDLICLEHGKSVIEHPQGRRMSYDQWQGSDKAPSNRELVRMDIDRILAEHPKDLQEFLSRLQDKGYTIRHGKNISLSHPKFQRSIRLSSLGKGYSEQEILEVLAGTLKHEPQKIRKMRKLPASVSEKTSLLIDIQKKMAEGKGTGYEKWATVFNLKQMAKTLLYLQENNLTDFDDLINRTNDAKGRIAELRKEIRTLEKQLADNKALQMNIINYSRTSDTYAEYRRSGYSKQYLAEHESDILIHKAAKKAFDDLHLGHKLPTVKSLRTEYASLAAQKRRAYDEYNSLKEMQRELLIHQENIRSFLAMSQEENEINNQKTR